MRVVVVPALLLTALLLTACTFDLSDYATTIDAVPPCVDGDADGDTVCNAVDKCPGADDRVDQDADGVPDGCDDWPCGATKPPDPGASMSDSAPGRSWSATMIEVGDARRVVVAAGQSFSIKYRMSFSVSCEGPAFCPQQLEYGLGPERLEGGCAYLASGNLSDEVITQDMNHPFYAPRTPTPPYMYEVRLNAARDSARACSNGGPWFGGDPGSESTIAIVCVRP